MSTSLRWWTTVVFAIAVSLWAALGLMRGEADTYAPVLAVAFCVSFLAVEMVSLILPRGGELQISAGVCTAGLLMLTPTVVTAAFAIGSIAGIGIRYGRSVTLREMADVSRRILVLFAVSLTYSILVPNGGVNPAAPRTLFIGFLAGCAYMLVDLLSLELLYSVRADGEALFRSLSGLVRLVGGVYLGQVSVGVVLALVYPRLGLMAFAILVILMLIMQHTFNLLLKVKSAYIRTVGALVRLAEIGTPKHTGHAERVSRMAARVGRKLGLDGVALERLTLAALLHDIGRVSLESDDDEIETNPSSDAVSEASVRLVSKVGFLASLAPVLAGQGSAYLSPMLESQSDALLAHVLRACSDFDDIRSNCGQDVAEREFLMKSGTVYDPMIVESILSMASEEGEIDSR